MNSAPNFTRIAMAFLLIGTMSAFVIPSGNSAATSAPRATQSWGLIRTQTTQPSLDTTKTATSLFAQKKRRRRKQPDQPTSDDETDELPDFDLVEDIDLKEQAEAKAPLTKSSGSTPSPSGVGVTPSSTDIDLNDPQVLAAMRATTMPKGMTVASTKDLIRSRNRDLEKKLVVNAIVEDVPSLADYTQERKDSSGVGKKASRRESRRAAAIEAEPDAPEESVLDSFLEKLPFFNKDKDEEKEEKTPIKVSHVFVIPFLCEKYASV
jgi:hypothetical protein